MVEIYIGVTVCVSKAVRDQMQPRHTSDLTIITNLML